MIFNTCPENRSQSHKKTAEISFPYNLRLSEKLRQTNTLKTTIMVVIDDADSLKIN